MTFRILALSGGGFLGLFSIRILSRFEEVLGRPIARSFDLVCGTSAGAITALALSLEKPAKDIENTFVEHGPKIFQRPQGRFAEFKRKLAFIRSLRRPRYCSEPLRTATESLIANGETLAEARHRLVIPVVNMTTGQIEVFKTPHSADWVHHAGLSMADVAVAAAAAPIYFPLAEVGSSLFVDGAIFASAPDLIGVHEAEHYLKQPLGAVEILSIGTTTGSFSLPNSAGRNYGATRWLRGARLFSTIISAQQQLTNVFLRHHLGERYHLLDSIRAGGLDADLGFDSATGHGVKTIFGLADHVFEEAMKDKRIIDIIRTVAPAPRFYTRAEAYASIRAGSAPALLGPPARSRDEGDDVRFPDLDTAMIQTGRGSGARREADGSGI